MDSRCCRRAKLRPCRAALFRDPALSAGFVIDTAGHIVTNDHVVKDAVDIRVTMTDRRILNAKLIGTDPLTDLAVIKVDKTNLPSVPWGESSKLHPGQTVLAFGNPFGYPAADDDLHDYIKPLGHLVPFMELNSNTTWIASILNSKYVKKLMRPTANDGLWDG
jgi:S1-C subfamily serine protease